MPVPSYGRGWTAIQVREGDNLSCRNARISENTIVSLPLIYIHFYCYLSDCTLAYRCEHVSLTCLGAGRRRMDRERGWRRSG